MGLWGGLIEHERSFGRRFSNEVPSEQNRVRALIDGRVAHLPLISREICRIGTREFLYARFSPGQEVPMAGLTSAAGGFRDLGACYVDKSTGEILRFQGQRVVFIVRSGIAGYDILGNRLYRPVTLEDGTEIYVDLGTGNILSDDHRAVVENILRPGSISIARPQPDDEVVMPEPAKRTDPIRPAPSPPPPDPEVQRFVDEILASVVERRNREQAEAAKPAQAPGPDVTHILEANPNIARVFSERIYVMGGRKYYSAELKAEGEDAQRRAEILRSGQDILARGLMPIDPWVCYADADTGEILTVLGDRVVFMSNSSHGGRVMFDEGEQRIIFSRIYVCLQNGEIAERFVHLPSGRILTDDGSGHSEIRPPVAKRR